MRGAIPVLTRAMRVEDAHPSVGLLSGATLLAMKLVAAGRIRLSESGDSWRVGPLQPEDDDRLHALATARAHGETTVDDAEDLIRQLLDAVADTMTRPPAAAAHTRRVRQAPPARPARPTTDDAATPRTPTCPTRSGSRCGSRRRRRCWRAAAWSSYSRRTRSTTTPTSSTPTSCGSVRDTASPAGPGVNVSIALREAAEAWAAAGPAAAAAGARPDGARRRRAGRPARARARGAGRAPASTCSGRAGCAAS